MNEKLEQAEIGRSRTPEVEYNDLSNVIDADGERVPSYDELVQNGNITYGGPSLRETGQENEREIAPETRLPTYDEIGESEVLETENGPVEEQIPTYDEIEQIQTQPAIRMPEPVGGAKQPELHLGETNNVEIKPQMEKIRQNDKGKGMERG